MARVTYNWDKLLGEYLASEYENKSEFAVSKGINPSFFRRNTTGWPNKRRGETGKEVTNQKVTKKNSSNVTKKQDKKSNSNDKKSEKKSDKKSNVTKNVTKKKVTEDKKAKQPKHSQNNHKLEYQVQKYTVPPEPEKLTEKEQLFCFNFVNVYKFNATQSYFNAYDCAYNTARVEGSRLLTKPAIRAEITRLKELKYQSLLFGVNDLVEKHMRIAFTPITAFLEFGRVEVPVMGPFGPAMVNQKVINALTGEEEEISFPVTKVVNDVRFKESIETEADLIQEVKVGKDGASIKLYSAKDSMDWLERYFSWNPMDRHKVAFDKAKLKIEQEKVNLEREAANKGQVTPEQGVKIVDDING